MGEDQVPMIERLDERMAVGNSVGSGAGQDGIVWHNPRERPFRISGFPWFERERLYRRMPRHPAEKHPEAVTGLPIARPAGPLPSRRIRRRSISGPS